jgi:hypothetical protein
VKLLPGKTVPEVLESSVNVPVHGAPELVGAVKLPLMDRLFSVRKLPKLAELAPRVKVVAQVAELFTVLKVIVPEKLGLVTEASVPILTVPVVVTPKLRLPLQSVDVVPVLGNVALPLRVNPLTVRNPPGVKVNGVVWDKLKVTDQAFPLPPSVRVPEIESALNPEFVPKLAVAAKVTVVVPLPLPVSVTLVNWRAPIASEKGPMDVLFPTTLSASAIRVSSGLSSPIVCDKIFQPSVGLLTFETGEFRAPCDATPWAGGALAERKV